MPATLNRKNNGKQFTVVDQETRSIIHWYIPGDHLPVLVQAPSAENYVITKEAVAEALKNQRAALQEVNPATIIVVDRDTNDKIQLNGKGNFYINLSKPTASMLSKADWVLCGIVGAAAVAVGYELVKVFA